MIAYISMVVLAASGDSLVVDEPRPLSAVMRAIEAKYAKTITYEDPLYTFSADLVDQVDPEFAKANPGTTAYVPKHAPLSVAWAEPIQMIQAALEAYARAGMGTFAVKESGGVLHVVPTSIRNSAGVWVSPRSVLDIPITISVPETSCYRALMLFANALGEVAHIRVDSVGPNNLLLQNKCALNVKDEPGRVVLLKMFAQLEPQLSWHLLADDSRYMLNVYIVQK